MALFVILFVIVALLMIYTNHRIRLNKEAELRSPIG